MVLKRNRPLGAGDKAFLKLVYICTNCFSRARISCYPRSRSRCLLICSERRSQFGRKFLQDWERRRLIRPLRHLPRHACRQQKAPACTIWVHTRDHVITKILRYIYLPSPPHELSPSNKASEISLSSRRFTALGFPSTSTSPSPLLCL